MKNRDDVRIMLKEAGILFAITLIAGLVLGFVYELTKEPVRRQQEKAVQEACAAVFSDAEQFERLDFIPDEALAAQLLETGVEAGSVFAAKDHAGSLLGYVVETVSREGYGGNIVLYTGVTLGGMVTDISILEISETPGLGMQAEKVLAPQFHNKTASEFTYTKNGSLSDSEIDAISGATITTEAVTNAVNGGLRIAEGLLQEGEESNE